MQNTQTLQAQKARFNGKVAHVEIFMQELSLIVVRTKKECLAQFVYTLDLMIGNVLAYQMCVEFKS